MSLLKVANKDNRTMLSADVLAGVLMINSEHIQNNMRHINLQFL